ncbi:MAG: hypothetical protein AMXMBFR33_12940 [Candidatus Xenobia bacterium]
MHLGGIGPKGFTPLPMSASGATGDSLPADRVSLGGPAPEPSLPDRPTAAPTLPDQQATAPGTPPAQLLAEPPAPQVLDDDNDRFLAGLRRAERRQHAPLLLNLDKLEGEARDQALNLARDLTATSQDPLVRRLARRVWPDSQPQQVPGPGPREPLAPEAPLEALIESVLQPGAPAQDRQRLATAIRDPEHKDRLAPHVDRLSRAVRESHPEQDMDLDFSRVHLTGSLLAAFPEVLTEDFFRHEVLGLAQRSHSITSDAARELATDCLKSRPELRDLIPEVILACRERNLDRLDSRDLALLALASEQGWVPGSETQKDWLAQWLHVPESLASSPTFQKCLAMVSQHASLYADCELPGPDGQVQKLPVALLMRASLEPDHSDLAEEAVGTSVRVRPVQAWHQRLIELIRQARPEPLLARTEEFYRQAGSLQRLSEEERTRLALVSTLPGTDEKLAALLSDERNQKAGVLNPLVDRLVRDPRRAEILREMSQPGVTAARVVELGRESLAMTMTGTSEEPLASVQSKMLEVLENGSSVAVCEQGEKLLAELAPELARYRAIEEVPPEVVVNLGLLTPFLCLDPELRKKAEPTMISFQNIDRNGWGAGWLHVGNQLSRMVMTSIKDDLSHLKPHEQRTRIHEAVNLAFLLGKGRQSNLSLPLAEWSRTCTEPAGFPREHWATDRVAWMETGLASVKEPRLRREWARQAADLKHSGRLPEIAQFAADVAREMLADELERLKSSDLTLFERSRHFGTAVDLVGAMGEGVRDLESSFLENASDWEKSLKNSTGFSGASRIHELIARQPGEPAETWALLQPVVGKLAPHLGLGRLLEALDEVPGRELKPEVEQFDRLVSALGPDKAYDALQLFRQVKILEKEGLPVEQALTRVVKQHLKMEADPGGALKESERSVTMGGVQLRKRTRT